MEDVLATVVDQLIIIVVMESCIDQTQEVNMRTVTTEILLDILKIYMGLASLDMERMEKMIVN